MRVPHACAPPHSIQEANSLTPRSLGPGQGHRAEFRAEEKRDANEGRGRWGREGVSGKEPGLWPGGWIGSGSSSSHQCPWAGGGLEPASHLMEEQRAGPGLRVAHPVCGLVPSDGKGSGRCVCEAGEAALSGVPVESCVVICGGSRGELMKTVGTNATPKPPWRLPNGDNNHISPSKHGLGGKGVAIFTL